MNDFDFLAGTWDVTNRRRTDFLDEASAWEEFPAVSRASRHFEGGASFDEIDFLEQGHCGLTLRLYDPEREQWSLYWSSSRTGALFPPVVGRFEDGRGEFHGDDTHDGKQVRVRFIGFLRGYSALQGGEETDSCGAGQGAEFRSRGEGPL
ncbi:hypothetical protein [Streptomyces sp. NPDC058092]|uniref:hypothetical protein n=1 Tax=Streptomyces sp. NPDC058092 TaxID=3346336 RepID=UPI0036E01D86